MVTSLLSLTSVLTWAVVALIGYFVLSWIIARTPKNLPPGPRGWRIHLKVLRATLSYSLHELAEEWAKQYGPLVYVNCLGTHTVFLNSASIVRRLYSSDDTKSAVADRATPTGTRVAFNGRDNIFIKFDLVAKKKRRMLFNVLHLYGEGVPKFESAVYEEMQRLFQVLEQHEKEDFELWRPLSRTIKAIVSILALGERTEDHILDALEAFDIAISRLLSSDFELVMSVCPVVCGLPGRYKDARDRTIKARELAAELIFYTPKKTYVPGKPRGIIDYLLDQQGTPGNEWMDDKTIISFLGATFSAAHLTSRTSILAAFLCFINYPETAKNIQEEIDRVLGSRQPKLEDRARMPYTEAAGLELLRIVSQVPLGGLRLTSSDVQIDGMTIPKNTVLHINDWFFHHDEKLWDDPWTFKPERFLDSSGQILPADDPIRKNLLPFGFGPRSCPGEVFAKTRVFLIVTSILQKYDVLPPANESIVPADFRSNHESVRGFVRQVQPYKCRLQRRQKLNS